MSTSLEQAYQLLRTHGPEYGPLGLSNHGPMAAEALAALGRDDEILPWAEQYATRLGPRPERTQVIGEDWRGALGRVERHSDWAELFEREIRESPWQTVLARWIPRLAPGLCGGALHGILRAAHAARAIAAIDSPLRRDELAQGLAYWAVCYYRLPGDVRTDGSLSVSEALGRIELLPADRRPGFGLITTALGTLDSFEPFARNAGILDCESQRPTELLSDLTESFAAAFIGSVNPVGLIALIHMVTGTSAVRLLLPYVEESDGRLLAAYAWQAGAALYTAFGSSLVDSARLTEPQPAETLIERALATEDEHGIKFTEACLREEAVRPEPIFRAAAHEALDQLRNVPSL